MKVLVTGGSAGIGEACVKALRTEGHDVWFTYRSHAKEAKTLASSLKAAAMAYDMTDAASVKGLCDVIAKEGFDGLVNNAASPAKREGILKWSGEEFSNYVTAQTCGVFEISRAFAESVRARKSKGAIVNVLSAVVLGLPPEKQSAYVAAKHLLWGLTQSQAQEFQRYGIRVNAVSPGMTRTDFNSDLPERFIEVYVESLPLGRLIEPDEVAKEIAFLISEKAAGVHAKNIPITG